LQHPPCRLAGPLRHARSFPPLGLLRGLRPTCGPQPATGLPSAAGPAVRRSRATAGGSHVHHVPISQVGVPLLPRQHHHAYAADLQRRLPTGSWRPASELTTPVEASDHALHPGPISARFEPGARLTGLYTGSSSYAFWPCLPNPTRLAVPRRPGVVRAAFHLHRRSPARTALSFYPAAATARR
jgi:hypothetical protein